MYVIKKSRNGSFVFKKFFKTKPMMKKNYEFEWLQKNDSLWYFIKR